MSRMRTRACLGSVAIATAALTAVTPAEAATLTHQAPAASSSAAQARLAREGLAHRVGETASAFAKNKHAKAKHVKATKHKVVKHKVVKHTTAKTAVAPAKLPGLPSLPPVALASAPARKIALGVTVAADDNPTDVSSYTTAAGRNPAILMWYSNWGGPLYYSQQMSWDDNVGATPMITWDPQTTGTDGSTVGVPLDAIAAGTFDSYIDSSAALAAAYGKPMLIRFAHEMNLSGSSYGPGNPGDTPQSFVAAWNHVVARFAADGVTNVRWVWSPNVNCGGGCPFDSYYPGNSTVDYVGLDGYNYAALHGIASQSFSQVFSSSYADITSLSTKPVIIAETATAGSGTGRASWIQDAFGTQIPKNFTRVVAAVWFDRDKETDWRVNATAQSLAAWKGVVADPTYQGTLTW